MLDPIFLTASPVLRLPTTTPTPSHRCSLLATCSPTHLNHFTRLFSPHSAEYSYPIDAFRLDRLIPGIFVSFGFNSPKISCTSPPSRPLNYSALPTRHAKSRLPCDTTFRASACHSLQRPDIFEWPLRRPPRRRRSSSSSSFNQTTHNFFAVRLDRNLASAGSISTAFSPFPSFNRINCAHSRQCPGIHTQSGMRQLPALALRVGLRRIRSRVYLAQEDTRQLRLPRIEMLGMFYLPALTSSLHTAECRMEFS